jgi:hypothetical protein
MDRFAPSGRRTGHARNTAGELRGWATSTASASATAACVFHGQVWTARDSWRTVPALSPAAAAMAAAMHCRSADSCCRTTPHNGSEAKVSVVDDPMVIMADTASCSLQTLAAQFSSVHYSSLQAISPPQPTWCEQGTTAHHLGPRSGRVCDH